MCNKCEHCLGPFYSHFCVSQITSTTPAFAVFHLWSDKGRVVLFFKNVRSRKTEHSLTAACINARYPII